MHQWHRVVARPGANGADISTGSCHDPVPELFLHRVIKRTGTKCLRMSTGGKNHPVPMSSRVWIFPSAGRPLSLSLSLVSLPLSFLLSPLISPSPAWRLAGASAAAAGSGQSGGGRIRAIGAARGDLWPASSPVSSAFPRLAGAHGGAGRALPRPWRRGGAMTASRCPLHSLARRAMAVVESDARRAGVSAEPTRSRPCRRQRPSVAARERRRPGASTREERRPGVAACLHLPSAPASCRSGTLLAPASSKRPARLPGRARRIPARRALAGERPPRLRGR